MTPQLLNNRYRILQKLGSGGFGDTFLAEDTQMPSGRRCVIKQLKPITDNPQIYQLVQQRFQREAAILEDLGEGNLQIPRLYAYFETDGQFYLVQEWIEGVTLTKKLHQDGQLREESVREILVSLLPVLDYVHSQRMIHRDIKPDNIILRQRDGKPVLIDFGAVKESMGTVVNSQGNTTSSIVIGTPGYMPSEQAAGRPVYSSDVYSLGLTAVYLLTGKTAQQLESDPQTGEIVWQQQDLNVSSSLSAVIDKAIMSHPRDRYPTAKAMLDALQSAVTPIAPTVPYIHPTKVVSPTSTEPSQRDPVGSTQTVANSIPPSSPRNGSNAFVLGSLIASGLIGAAVVIAFALKQPSEPIPTQPANSVSSQISNPTPSAESKQSNNINNLSNELNKLNNPSGEATNQPSPEKIVQDYYANINQGKYQSAWRQQSPRLQSNRKVNPNGYDDYLKFWETVEQVDVQKVQQVEKTDNTATVDVQLTYLKQGGNSEAFSWRYSLVWDAEENSWLLDDREVLSASTSQPTTDSRPSPQQVIQDYYSMINSRQLEAAWNQLSSEYQNNLKLHPKGYFSYVSWWNTVNSIEVQQVSIAQPGTDSTRVDAQLRYVMKNGKQTSSSVRFLLVWDAEENSWKIQDTKLLP